MPIWTAAQPVASGKGTTAKTKAQKAKEEAEAKAEAERRKKQEKELQAAIALIQYEYGEKVLDAKRMFISGMYDSDKDYEKDLEDLQKEELNKMLDTYVAAGQIGQEKAQEMQEKLMDIYVQAKQKLVQEAADMAARLKEEFETAERETEHNNVMSGDGDDNTLDARLERYKAFLQAKLDAEGNTAELQKKLWEEYDNAEKQLEENKMQRDEENRQKQLDNAQSVYGEISSALGSAFDEMFASEGVSFKAFMKSMLVSALDMLKKYIEAEIVARQVATKGFAGLATAAALTALVEGSFAAAKAAIKNFSVGGYVSGAGTGTSDSIPARLSNGESVMTAKATSMFSPILSAFNQLGGGVPIVTNNYGSNIGMDMLAAAVAKGYMMAPRPVVSVEEITSTQKRVETIETIGRI